MQFRTLENTPLPIIHDAFLDAFSTYAIPFNLSLKDFQYLLERRQANLAISCGAFDGEELVGIVLNAIGEWQEVVTAYDVTTGVIQAYQGKGVGKKLFEFTAQVLLEAGAKQYLLEVLQGNESAVRLYRGRGFSVTRELDYYEVPAEQFQQFPRSSMEEVEWNIWEGPWEEVNLPKFDCEPTWQNHHRAVGEKWHQMQLVQAMKEGELVGLGILEPHTGDVPQFWIAPNTRRKGIGTELLLQLGDRSLAGKLRLINIDRGYHPASAWLNSLGIEPKGQQYEMLLKW